MPETSSSWTFLTNHSHVLFAVWRESDIRVRDIAQLVGITERAVMRIISELSASGFVEIEKVGRENRYTVVTDMHLRHPLEDHRTVGELLETLEKSDSLVTQ